MAGGCWRFRCPGCGQVLRWQGTIGDQPPCPACQPQQRPLRSLDLDALEDAQDALDQCDRILEAYGRLPRKARSTMGHVRRTVEGIRSWAEAFLQITPAQQGALDAIEDELGRLSF